MNVSEVINKIFSFAYLIDSYDVWLARLGHVNSSYVNKLQSFSMITLSNEQFDKCNVCLEFKLTKKKCLCVQHESDPP